jgi:hypothetical protein
MTAIIIIAVVAAIFLIFVVLQWTSDRTYKPTIAEIIGILDACQNGRLSLSEFDEFSCVRIAYDSRLDTVREKFNQIVGDSGNIDGEFSDEDATALNDAGKRKIGELIDELRQLEA